MFLILQLLLIIINFFNMNNTIFNIDLHYIIKLIIFCYVLLFIMFLSSISNKMKLGYLSLILILFSSILFDSYSVNKLINNLYYINTYSFLLSFYYNNNFKKYKVINLSTLILILLNIYILITKSHSFTLEIILNILIPISLVYFESNKKLTILILVLTLTVAYFNNMNLIFYNLLFISLIMLIYFHNKKDNIYFLLVLLLFIFIISIFNNAYNYDTLLDSFSMFDLSFNFYSFITLFPIFVLTIMILNKILKNNNKSFGMIIILYTLILITIFAILSIKNIENEFIILAYSYLLVIEMKNIKQISNKLDNSVTILALHLGYGGIEQYISSLTKMINKKIYIVSTYKLYDKPPFEYNASISYLMDYGPNTKEIKDALRSKNIIKVFKEGIRSLKILYLKKYDNIEKIEDINSEYIITTREIHNELVGYYGRSDIIKIATEHNYHNNNKKYIKRLVNSVKNMNYFVLVSKYLEEYYKDKVKINTICIPNVLEKLPREKSTSFGHNLVSVGRLSKVKAQDELIELIAMLKEDYNDIKLTLIGDGEERSYLEDLIKSKNLTKNITITGFLKKDEIAKELVKNNIFVTTSKSEAFGLVAIEACSFYLPVVAFDSAMGLKEILKDDNGVLIQDRNLEEMKVKIEKLFDDKKYRDKISENGYLNAKKYLLSNVKKMWKEIIN